MSEHATKSTNDRTASSQHGFEVTHKSVALIAIPMTLAYLSTPFVGLADTWAIGQLEDASLIGAIAVGSIIFDVLFSSMAFLRMGTTGLVAQAFGAGDRREQTALLFRALVIAAVLGALAILLREPIGAIGLAFLGGPDDVRSAAAIYFEIRVVSAPLVFANYAILGYFVGRGQAGRGLVLQTVLNLSNIGLNLWFVFGLGWGVAGVAWASVAAEIIAFLAGLLLLAPTLLHATRPDRARIFKLSAFKKMLSVNGDILIRSLALLFAFATFTRLSAQQGELVLAANAILQKLFLIASYFLDGLATAAEQLAGRAVGSKRKRSFIKAVRLCTFWSVLLAGIVTALYLLFGDLYLQEMTTSEEVRAVGSGFVWLAAITPLVAVGAVVLDGVFIGATWSRDMRNMMVLSLILFLLSAHVLSATLGNLGLWLSLLLFLAVRGVTLLIVLPTRVQKTFG